MLQQTERFQTEVKNYKQSIENLKNPIDKEQAEKLLNNLIYEVRNLDSAFTEMVYQKQLASQGSEMRERITEIRKKLDDKIKKQSV